MWMIMTFTAFIMSAMTVATIGNLSHAEEKDKDLLATAAAVRQEGKSAGFLARLKAKLEKMVKGRKGLTVDSGAADHVMPIDWLTWIVVTASMGSIRGLHYVSASGNRLPNRGEQTVRFLTKDGTRASLLFQVAGINKPLVSVSRLIDEGWKVFFDIEGSYLLHKASKRKIMMDRTRGVFTVEAYVEPEDKAPGFRRKA